MRNNGDLSDSERRRLAEIESSLRADDPGFVQRFEDRRLRRRRTQHRVLALLAIVVALIVTAVALVRGSVIVAVIGLVAIGATAGIWAAGRHR
jgi:hypothetical protein